ncbi:MAG: stage III sporulation protein AC [Clostridia bacterium]|nr:stage III sporulation protein AC [Clostridia bacterium]MBQ3463264.1 stage III sporulation protein AC [Clostridia bacterium]MBQ6530790.1 stage III sporulation protein AC [Clostridia bacterium]MBQ9599703.1 stage III sporulation protein AC [Clostridia bacterium]MBR0027565.1 stage III sporulation protein AC [Clostridia bacterium]
MNIDLIFQIAGVGIIVAVLNQLLTRAGREEQALLTTIAGLVVVLFIVTQQIGELFESVKRIFNL